jgi:hypothetical protein
MPDTSTILRLVDELLWSLRREGVRIATSQAIDLVRAIEIVGIEDRTTLLQAFEAVLCKRERDRRVLRETFERFFDGPRTNLWERLAKAGFSEMEMNVLRALLAELASAPQFRALVERGAELDRLLTLAEVEQAMSAMHGAMQAGFFGHRVLESAGLADARSALAAMRIALRDALGARGDALADALSSELDEAAREIRDHVRHVAKERETPERAPGLARKAFFELDPREVEEVRRAVRSFAARLRGRERIRKRRSARGRIDPHRVLRRALRTGGVPFELPRKRRRKDRPKLFLLCDISDSVRRVATFLLEFVHVAHDLWDSTRSFVFVGDIGETTELFRREPIAIALAQAYGGSVTSVSGNSNYGRALRTFVQRHLHEIDRRSTVVILGDGRTNYTEDGADSLAEIRDRAGAVLWLCPEPRGAWGTGDSAMMRYIPIATDVLSVMNAQDLESSARTITGRLWERR